MEKVSIIIPCHNEEKRIGRTLDYYTSYFNDLKKRKKLDYEIIIVLNACKDNTKGVVKKYKPKNIKILNFKQGGKGFAITEGFKEALKGDKELIGYVDADMATPPNAFYGLVKNIRDYDGVIANRWDKRSKISKRSLVRKILSEGFNIIARGLFFFNHRDTQCGAKLFKKELIEKILPLLGSSEWSFDIDLLFYARREHAKIISIPTEWNDEKGSKINLKRTPLSMFLSVIRLRLVHSPFTFIVRFYRELIPSKFKFYHK